MASELLDTADFTFREIEKADDLITLWNKIDVLSIPQKRKGRYLTGFASSDKCVTAAKRLRYEIFNLELGEGLEESKLTGLDQDKFDAQMTHLVLVDTKTRRLVGTYRMQTVLQAQNAESIYAAAEYDLSGLEPYFDRLVELGRACLAEGHRKMATLIQLWLGIAAFMNLHKSRYLFGCCSLTTQDPDDGWRAKKTLRKFNAYHPDILLPATPEYSCGNPQREFDEDLGERIPIPKLFSAYLRLGCQVVSEPALDKEFKTIDFLILLDAVGVKMSTLNVVE